MAHNYRKRTTRLPPPPTPEEQAESSEKQSDDNDTGNNYVEIPVEKFTGSNDSIDYAEIVKHEKGKGGIYSNEPLVPTRKDGTVIGKSGVTFSGGLDLGQIDEKEARELAKNMPGLYEKIEPYIGAKGKNAQKLIAEKGGPNVTPKELITMTKRKYDKIYNSIKSNYDVVNGKGSFDELPKPVKTTIISVGTQYGPNLPEKTPNFWEFAADKDFKGMYNELLDFKDIYKSRRELEAEYLKKEMDW